MRETLRPPAPPATLPQGLLASCGLALPGQHPQLFLACCGLVGRRSLSPAAIQDRVLCPPQAACPCGFPGHGYGEEWKRNQMGRSCLLTSSSQAPSCLPFLLGRAWGSLLARCLPSRPSNHRTLVQVTRGQCSG